MLFNSYIFVFVFFPVCLLGYYGLLHFDRPGAARAFLAGMSLWFYGYFNLSYLLIMLGSIAVNYLMHLLLSRYPRKSLMVLAVTLNLCLLFYFKYYDFFLSTVNAVFDTSFLLKQIVLPLGISFFTFQQISFVTDTYRGEVRDCGLVEYVLFVSFFPQLIAGPIVNHEEMLPQFRNIGELLKDEKSRRELLQGAGSGAALFVMGLAKKVLIADTIGKGVDYGYANIELLGSWDALLVIFFYTFQLYFDFSGYCDMARGLGRMLGIEIPENFRSPYQAVNLVDFWKRWHITLNRFFTKYVYIPLGGNRRGALRMYRNLLLVFFLSGLWHGAGWNFIIWGMLHGILYVITRWFQRRRGIAAGNSVEQSRKPVQKLGKTIMTWVSRIALFLYVSAAWVFFRASDTAQAVSLFARLVKGTADRLSRELAECFRMDEFWYVLKVLHLDQMTWSPYILMFAAFVVCVYLAMIGPNAAKRVERMKYSRISAVALGGMLVWCILTFSEVSTFLYFNF